MSRLLQSSAFTLFLSLSQVALANIQTVSCPNLSLSHYGKNTYYDAKIGKVWRLSWQKQQAPVWNNVLIPQTSFCGKGKSKNGMLINYQCAVFECKSDAVVASLEQNQRLKCFSTYVSNNHLFYCDGFSMK